MLGAVAAWKTGPCSALGRLIADAATRSQVFVVSHANRLIATLTEARGCNHLSLEKSFGETRIAQADEEGTLRPPWQWPSR